jgi:membrane protein required for colicin V production
MGWNWLDWVLAIIVVSSVVAATLKGFARELISLAAVAAGLLVAALGYQRTGVWLDDLTHSHEVALGVAFLSLFAGVLVLGTLVSYLARKLIQKVGLQWFDRFLGAVFGMVRGVAVSCALLMIMMAFALKSESVQSSRFAPYVVVGARLMVNVMPGDLRSQFRNGFDKFRRVMAERDKSVTK